MNRKTPVLAHSDPRADAPTAKSAIRSYLTDIPRSIRHSGSAL